MLRPFPARVRARVEPLDAHLLGLTVDRLNRATMGSDVQLVAPVMRAHLLATGRDEPNASVSQQTGGADGGLVADEPRAGRQSDGQLVERRQVVIRCRQELEADRPAAWRADQMQAPAKQSLVFGRTIASKRSPARVATAPRADPTADGQGHAVDDEHVSAREQLPQRGCQKGDPIGSRCNWADERYCVTRTESCQKGDPIGSRCNRRLKRELCSDPDSYRSWRITHNARS